MKPVILFTPLIVLVLGGCTMTPKYHRPAPPVPAEWSGAGTTDPSGAPDAANLSWREFFRDEKLQQVIELALTNNRDLRIAALNVERARALYGIQRAELLPAVDAFASGAVQRLPADLSGSGRRQTVERYDVNLGVAAWELDLFGRIRSLKDSALEEYLATDQARRGAQIALVSSVAQAYLTLAADRESLALARATLETQQAVYDLIKTRFDLGLIPELDVHRAQAQVDAARADVVRYTQAVAQDRNALDLLAGGPVPEELLPADLGTVASPAEISAGLPSEVLLQRPDVLQAENLLKAAHADIGAARAAFFPRISLTAAIGTASADLSGLFKAGSGAWSYAPQIVMPIFDARTWSAHRASKVQREIAVGQYERAIQNAFRDVNDALAVRATVDEQIRAQESLVRSLAETLRLATSRYERGIDSYLAVLDAQRSHHAAQQQWIALRRLKLANDARLYAALGGGLDQEETGRQAALK